MRNEKVIKSIAAVLLVIIAAISIFALSPKMSDPATYTKTIEYLDEKKETVMQLTAASTAASATITLLPGDTATPIADKLADLSTYFLVVVSAIYLEKYMVSIVGYAAFTFVIPIALILYAVYLFWKSDGIRVMAKKALVLGLAMAFIIPAGVKVSGMIEDVYGSSMQETIEAAEAASAEAETETSDETEESNWFSNIISSVQDTATNVTQQFENVLNKFIEALAVLIVTSCVIPILVLLFFLWVVKTIVGVDIKLPHSKIAT